MAVTTAAVVGLAGSAYGAYNSYQGAQSQQDAARAAQQAAGRTASLGQYSGSGGGYNFNAGNGNFQLGYGAAGDALNQIFSNASQNSGLAALSQGLPQNVMSANAGVTGMLNQFYNPSQQQQNVLTGQLGTAFNQANQQYGGLANMTAGAQSNLTNTAFTGAANQAALAGQGFNDVRDSTLATLREQAQPFETRQLNSLNQNLFSTGRLGTTGGALQTEAFARGLGQADLQRQLTANNEARLTQQQSLAQAQGLSGIGSGMLNDAFNRFGQTASIYDQSLQQRFANSALVNQQNFGQQQQNFQNQLGLAGLPAQLQGANLQNALLGLQGQQGLQGLAMNLANFGLNQGQVEGNLNLGQASNVVNAAQNPNIGAGRDFLGQLFTGIGSRASDGSLQGMLGSIFGNQNTAGIDWNQAAANAGMS